VVAEVPVELLRELDVEGIRQAVNLPAMKWSSEDVRLGPNCPLCSPRRSQSQSSRRVTKPVSRSQGELNQPMAC
jgi:hypothetical protein